MDVLALNRRHLAALATAVLVASAAGCAVDDSGTPSAGPPEPASTGSAPAQVAERVGSVVPEAPRGIQLPNGRRVGIRAVGSTRNGVLDVPEDIDRAGWWSGGSRLGDPFGSTLVAAHVDSRTQGLGPFASLLTVQPGDRVYLWSDGLRQTFEVKSRWLRPQGTLGPGSWLHSPEGSRRLTLVTCAGPYDAARGGYQNLAVIVAEPLDGARRRP
jgi:Sortase domain